MNCKRFGFSAKGGFDWKGNLLDRCRCEMQLLEAPFCIRPPRRGNVPRGSGASCPRWSCNIGICHQRRKSGRTSGFYVNGGTVRRCPCNGYHRIRIKDVLCKR